MCFPVFPIATHAATGCGSHRQTRKLRCFFRMATLFSKVTPKSCLRGLPACHRDQCSTYSIDVVSKCSYGHSSCFSWSNVLHSNQAAAQQQEAVGSIIPNINGKITTCSKPPTSYTWVWVNTDTLLVGYSHP